MPRVPEPPEFASSADAPPTVGKIGDLAAEAGIGRVHMLAWRDLADVEAGGSEIHASAVASLWAQAGVEVTIRTSYAQGSPPETTRDGYRVIRRAGRYLVFPRAAFAEATGRHGPRDALVEIWNGVPFFSPVWARGPRVTWLHHVHTEMWPLVLTPRLARIGQFLESRLAPPLYRRTPVVTLSESSKAMLLQRLGFRDENVHVVVPGISPMFSGGGEKSESPSVLAVGRLMPPKAFDELIEAMVRVREVVPATLTIVGEGYARDALQNQISRLGAEHWCELAGRVDDQTLVGLYRSSWVVAAASRSEGWGMTLTEAAACGTPAVATRIAGHCDAVSDGVTGLLVDSPNGLVEALVSVLSNPELRDRMAEAARRRALGFTWECTAHDTMAVLASAARRTRHGS